MTFPLPNGVCREVCRPQRLPPRRTKVNDALRMSRAAIRNGGDGCELLAGILAITDCEICQDEQRELAEARTVLSEGWNDVMAARAAVLESLGIDPERETLGRIRRLVRALRFLFTLMRFARAVDDLLLQISRLNRAMPGIQSAITELFQCLGAKNDA